MTHEQETQFNYLFSRYVNRLCTRDEYDQFLQMLADADNDPEISSMLQQLWKELDRGADPIELPNVRRIRLWPRVVAAASIILAFSAGTYFILHKKPAAQNLATNKTEELAPMDKGVILTTSAGKTLLLSKSKTGKLQTADGANASQSDTALIYSQVTENTAPVTHTLTNNTGNKYELKLADGTEVILDATSEITFPVAFTGKERRVSMTGQAYFKVKHNAGKPFYVAVADEIIRDIGTEFNINAYSDESALRTTLVEGAVKVSRGSQSVQLKPGEQVLATGEALATRTANLEETLAWLQGRLIFNNEPLENLMNRVARIYNVKLDWVDPETKTMKFGGSLNRTKKLATVLNYFRKTGNVDFKVENNTVKIFKKKKTT